MSGKPLYYVAFAFPQRQDRESHPVTDISNPVRLIIGLLVLLGLWLIKDIKKNRGQHFLFKIRGTYELLFIGILLLSGFAQKNESTNTEINSQSSSIIVSSQPDKSKNQSSSKAEAISKANPESIAASVKAASEASEKAAYDASEKVSSEAAVSSQNAASENENTARASAAKETEAESVAQQTTEQSAPQNDTGRTVFVTGGGRSDVYWYSTSSMPARTNKNNIITMTEADAIAQGKRHSMTE